ncbi:glycosyltransferase [Streptomyces polygonati]|uniref:Glycosyltransferase n=1 Tax=Streptomyces polygonati TaxID=1617087 RepID=A0ABV8HT84_9ACTN
MTSAALPEEGGTAPVALAPVSRLRFWLGLAPALAAVTALVHLPSFLRPVWNPDEGFLAIQARLLAHGGVVYQTVVDRKPPLLPWLYEGAFAAFGDTSLWPLRTAALLAHLATALLTASLARRRWGDRPGLAAGFGVALLSVGLAPEDTQAASFEVFILPWTVAALWCADRTRFGWAGAALAVAALTKQTGLAALVPVLWLAWRAPGAGFGRRAPSPGRRGAKPDQRAAAFRSGPALDGEPWPGPDGLAVPAAAQEVPVAARGPLAPRCWALLRVAGGFAVPVALVAAASGPGRFVFWTLTGSAAYASPSGAWLIALARAYASLTLLGVAAGGLLVVACAGLVLWPAAVPADLWLWLGASTAAVATGFQFYGHYFLQLVPPLVLTGVAAARRLPRCWPAVTAWTVLTCAAFVSWGLTAPRPELDHARTVASAVRAHTDPRQPVLVWGMHPEDYWLADRTPSSRFLTAGFLTNFSGGRRGVRVGERYAVPGAWRIFRAEFAAHPPSLVVDDSRGAPYATDRTPTLRRLLLDRYRRVAVVDGAVMYARGPASWNGRDRW